MRWRRGRRSSNVEDRRGSSGGGGFRFPGTRGKGGGFRIPTGRRGSPVRRGGIGGIGLIIVVGLFLLFGGDLGGLLQQSPVSPNSGRPSGTEQFPQLPNLKPGQRDRTDDRSGSSPSRSGDEALEFVSAVLADTEDTWNALFKQFGQNYREPKLVVFSGSVRSACGFAQSAMGPFYCPGDQKVYLDMSFFRDLKTRFGAPGDFAQAYVIAHEIGHHVQTILGISNRVRQAQSGASQSQTNAIQVRMELQADCFAGVWAHHANNARNILEAGDVEEALGAANAIGDDRLQRQSQGRVVPDSFTHGSSEQRMRWFRKGLDTGNLRGCDTFRAEQL